MKPLEKMRLGQSGPEISRLGMGCWAIGGHGWGKVKDGDSIGAIKCALDNGVTFFDTADTYGLGKSETLLSNALGPSRKDVVIASKGGVRWNESGQVWSDISPGYLRQAVENSLRRLDIDCIPLYYIHKPDNVTPVQESVFALERLREQGKIGAIGVSNFSGDQLLQVLQVAPISAVQIRFNIFDQNVNKDIIHICREHNITLVAWGVLADGLLTGKFKTATTFSDEDHRSRMVEFSKKHFSKYVHCVSQLEDLAASTSHTMSQLAIRWVLDFAPFICSLFGAKTERQVKENLAGDGWTLSEKTLRAIDIVARIFQK